MRCPYCGYRESKVVDSRPADEGSSIRRRRECLSCMRRFTTYETVESLPMGWPLTARPVLPARKPQWTRSPPDRLLVMKTALVDSGAVFAYQHPDSRKVCPSGPRWPGIALRQRVAPTGAMVLYSVPFHSGRGNAANGNQPEGRRCLKTCPTVLAASSTG